jgi:integrase
MQNASRTGVDATQTLAEYVTFIGDRWSRGIDPTSTYDPYSAGLRLRVVPTLGHIPVAMITAGLVDRALDQWETEFGRSTIKNTVSALVLVLNEAVRDGIIARNPATDRARRRTVGRSFGNSETSTPRDLALPNVAILEQLVVRVVEAGKDQSWGDVVTILATTALRISEVSGLRVDDVDLVRGLIHVLRQTYPGRGGLVTKETKGRRRKTVPIIDPLRPTLVRLTAGRRGEERLVLGPRGGVITTATLRDATGWDALVTELGQPGLVRHTTAHRPDMDGRCGRRSPYPAASRRPSGSGSHGSLPSSRPTGHAGRWKCLFGLVVRSCPERPPLGVIEGGKNVG